MSGAQTKTVGNAAITDLQRVKQMVLGEDETGPPHPQEEIRMPIGQVVSVSGAHVLIMVGLSRDMNRKHAPRVGSMVCIETGTADIVAGVSGLSSPTPGIDNEEGQVLIAELELIGELHTKDDGNWEFRRGLSTFPALGDIAAGMTNADLALIYGMHETSRMRVGQVSDAGGIPARLDPDELLNGNFALFGSAGAGKSCGTAVLVRALVKSRHPVKIVLIDPHNEYTRSFGRAANVLNIANGVIAHWILTFRELVYALGVASGTLSKPEMDILASALCAAKKRFIQANPTSSSMRAAADGIRISVDTPIPYRMADVSTYIEKAIQSDGINNKETYRHLKARIDAVVKDHQYRVLFGGVAARDCLADFLSNLFRIPTAAKPITVLQFGDLEPEICEVIVSVVARYAQLIAESQKGDVPLLLLLEEAHRYLPENPKQSPISSRTLNTILDKSTKLSVSIGLVTGRLRLISSSALEHCNTMLAMRLPSRADQQHLLNVTPETASGLLANVGVMDKGECVVIGPGAPVPMRLSFVKLPAEAIPAERRVREEPEGDLPPTVAELGLPFLENLIDDWRFDKD